MSDERRVNSCDSPSGCKYAEEISRESADAAVKKVFAILGVDIGKPESVESFRDDLRFGAKLHKIANHGTMAFIGVIAGAMAVLIWESLKNYRFWGR